MSRLLSASLLALAPLEAEAQVSITNQPQPVTVLSGQPATFSVTAAAAGAPSYQWRRNGYALPGATTTTLTIPAATQGHNDLYDVVVTSGAAATVSQPARLLVTLPSYPNAITTDLTRSLRLEGVDEGSFIAQAALPDGRYYIIGSFTTVSGQPRRDLVRLNTNGTVDTSFTPPSFDVVPAGLTLQPDGKLLVSGFFKSVGGVPTGGLVRLNADGSRDNTFAVGGGFTIGVRKAFFAPDGMIYVTGYGLGSYQGSANLGYVARLTATGALDPTFVGPTFWIGSSGTNPTDFAMSSSGEIYAVGNFDRVNDVARTRLVRLTATGGVDATFNTGTGPNGFIFTIVPLSNGQLVISGDFTRYNVTNVGRIARLNRDGSLDSTFAIGAGFSSQVNFVAELPGNFLFVGPVATTLNGTFTHGGIRLTPTGALDSTFVYTLPHRPDALSLLPGNRLLLSGNILEGSGRPAVHILEANGTPASSLRPTFRFPARARLLAHLPGGKILAAGDFTSVNGATTLYVMRLNADLSRDSTFPNGPGPSAPVVTGVVQPDGKMVLFTTAGMVRLNVDGSTDTSFATGSTFGFWYPAPPIMLPDGRIFVVTDSSFWNGLAVSNGFVLLEPNGTRVTSHPLLPGPPAGTRIYGAQLLPNGQLLVTGSFPSWNGVTRDKAVRFRTDGTIDPAFTLDPAFTGPTRWLRLAPSGPAYQRDGRLVAMSDQSPVVLARFNLDGSRDAGFGGPQPTLFDAGRLLIQPDDRIIMMAQERGTSVGPAPVLITRFTREGTPDASFMAQGSAFWYSALLADNGELLSSDNTGYLHRYRATPVPIISIQPAGQAVTAGTSTTLRVTASGSGTLSYQWFRDGTAIAGATTSILSLDNASAATAGSYTVVVSSAAGSVTSQAAAITINTRPAAGTYFGTLNGPNGTFSLLVRENGTGVFLGFIKLYPVAPFSPTTLFSRDVVVDGDRRFRFPIAAITATGTIEHIVTGEIAVVGTVTGTIATLGLTLAAPAPTIAAASPFPGFYQAGETGRSTTAYAIVGAGGQFHAATAGGTPFSASGTLDPSGTTSIPVDLGARMEFSFQAGTPLWSTTVIQPGSAARLVFSGANNESREDVEKLVNISTRTVVNPGGSFTAGFVVIGDQPKPVLVRAIGPTLASFQVAGALPAAHLAVYRGTTLIASGDDWAADGNATPLTLTAQRVGAFALPTNSRDAALLLNLEPGAYSVVVSGQGGASGVALAEIYDATDGPILRSRRIVNISTLARAGSDAATLASGFVVNGTVPKRVLVRGAGPALAAFGVTDALARPQVSVYSGSTVLALNASWSAALDPDGIAAAAKQVGAFAFPAGSHDAALIINLAPGAYTAQVTGLNGTTGTALVEVYELP